MVLIRSDKIVHLNSSGEVIWEEWPCPSAKMMSEQADVIHSNWMKQASTSCGKNSMKDSPQGLPITSIAAPHSEPSKGFGYDYSTSHNGRKFKRFGTK